MARHLIRNVAVWAWGATEEGGERGGLPAPSSGRVVPESWVVIDSASGSVVGVGDGTDVFPGELEDYADCLDGAGLLVLPGLMDAHIHVAGTGESASYLNLAPCRSIADLQAFLATHAADEENADLPWLVGHQWDQTDLGRFPTRQDLDQVCPNRPVFIWRACWHVGVANTKALQLAGILGDDGATLLVDPHPEGGSIELEDQQQQQQQRPTGLLKERAVELVTTVMARGRTEETKKRFILSGIESCLSRGLTAVQTNDEGCWSAYKDLLESDELPLRVFLTPTFDDFSKDESAAPVRPDCFSGAGGGGGGGFADSASLLVVDRLKVFSDGSLGADTAALRADADADAQAGAGAGARGMLIHSQEQLCSMLGRAKAAGWRAEVHAIGDRAAESVLDALQAAGLGKQDRPILTHCQVLGADLIARMAAAGVVANVQPSFVPTDMRWVQQRLSPARQRHSYAWRSLLEAGVVVAGGSDAPIEDPGPFIGMYDAIFRESRDAPGRGEAGSPPPDPQHQFQPREALSLSEAVWTYTVGAAWAAGVGAERVLGQVRQGFAADLVLVDARIASDCRRLLGAKPAVVIVGGRVVYSQLDGEGGGEGGGGPAAMSGPFVPGKAGCPCCRPDWRGRRGAGGGVAGVGTAGAGAGGGAGGSKSEARWEAALDDDETGALGGAGIASSEDVFCLMAAPRPNKGKGRGSARGNRPRLK